MLFLSSLAFFSLWRLCYVTTVWRMYTSNESFYNLNLMQPSFRLFCRSFSYQRLAWMSSTTIAFYYFYSNNIEAQRNSLKIPMRQQMECFVKQLQKDIVSGLETLDGSKFWADEWQRKEGGGGISCVLQDGKVFEKAGVNVSVIHGPLPEKMVAQMRARKDTTLGEGPFQMFATGISMVLHPHNPNAPTAHLNYRYFELSKDNQVVTWWFGGGCDLTPSYLYEEDAIHFHQVIKDACDTHDPNYYPEFKQWCDRYFTNTHRDNERRGIGGIFFDDLDGKDPETLFAFVKDCGNAFLKQYLPIMEKRKDMPFTPAMKQWQQLRRGRYVEFNLVHDRGTKFGLVTPGARIESILMSLPLTARWEYRHEPTPGSPEAELVKVLKEPRNWVLLNKN
jgi:coproporphyrinogen III oxidase